mmetsp:Transcript_18522/g.21021  ORF Transcript_18522/g.21021 Transcript_18522/m.21021 type:complete len:258 (+) Transcript_18522:43-816(+)
MFKKKGRKGEKKKLDLVDSGDEKEVKQLDSSEQKKESGVEEDSENVVEIGSRLKRKTRRKGLAISELGAEFSTSVEDEEIDPSIKTFSKQTAKGLDSTSIHRKQFIEEQLKDRFGTGSKEEVSGSSSATTANDSTARTGEDAHLFAVPDHLKVKDAFVETAAENTLWQGALLEVGLDVKYKMKNIEELEKMRSKNFSTEKDQRGDNRTNQRRRFPKKRLRGADARDPTKFAKDLDIRIKPKNQKTEDDEKHGEFYWG